MFKFKKWFCITVEEQKVTIKRCKSNKTVTPMQQKGEQKDTSKRNKEPSKHDKNHQQKASKNLV